MFPGTKVGNIRANLPIVVQALTEAELADKDMLLMALGTIRAETASFMPISEGISKFNTTAGSHPFNLYDNRTDLGNKGTPDGEQFKGRGFIQLTGRANYQQHSLAIGLGSRLVENPDLANEPDIAAKLLASFIKKKEPAIRKALSVGDLKKARKLVNGGSHGLAEFKQAFETGRDLLAEISNKTSRQFEKEKGMNIASQNRLKKVHPELARRVTLLIEELAKQGLTVEVVKGLRTFAEQDELYKQGRSKPGQIVTKARGGQSNHNYGLAVDLCPFVNGKPQWNDNLGFVRIGLEATKLGLDWGGSWKKFIDKPHVQMPGMTIAQCLALYNKGGLANVWANVPPIIAR